MFILTLSPIRSDAALTVEVEGDTLILNGAALDFAPLPEGAILPQAAIDSPWIASDVTRQNGALQLSLVLPHGPIPWPAPPEAAAVTHPEPITVTTDGPVGLPVYAGVEHAFEEVVE